MSAAWFEDYLAAWSAHDGERVAAFLAEDGVFEDVALGESFTGREALAAFVDQMVAMAPDFAFVHVASSSTDTDYHGEWRSTGTMGGSDKRFDVRGVSVGRLRDGKIVENRDYWNMAEMMNQVG